MAKHLDEYLSRLEPDIELPKQFNIKRSRIMYIEEKESGLEGQARIGRVYFSKSGRTLYYKGKSFQSLKGAGYKSNYFEVTSGEHFWISGPRKDENNRLYGGNLNVHIDDDIKEEYLKLIST